MEEQFIRDRLSRLREEKQISDATDEALKKAIGEFKAQFRKS